ncbi:MAG: exodeoxyribonuclease VII large subunit [Sulfurovum sp.]
MNNPLSVTTLNAQIKSLLETTFMEIYVEGEVSNLTYHSSGHIYFSVKDTNSSISCVMFKGNRKYLKFELEVGQKVVIRGSLTVYAPRGNYQILCNKIEPSGQGALALAFEQLKKKLQAKGYFDPEIKKELPKYPKKIALVTSATGAAIEDMKKVALHRWPLVEFTLINTLVQGEGAAYDISESIKYADTLNADIMIVGRGGGSIEDLWAFNEEIVANAIYQCKTPIISAVGHEIDYVISDFVSDIRAATPSNAVEIALPDINEHRIYLDNLYTQINNSFVNHINKKQEVVNSLVNMFKQNSVQSKFKVIQSEINLIKESYKNRLKQKIQYEENQISQVSSSLKSQILLNIRQFQNQLDYLNEKYKINHYENKIKDGKIEISRENKKTSLDSLKKNDEIILENLDLKVSCIVSEVKKR